MFKIFQQKCVTCGQFHFGPREGGKSKGRWLGYNDCPKCRKEKEENKEQTK